MRKIKFNYHTFLFLFLTSVNVEAQVSHSSNNGGTASDYVGWDLGELFPLEVRHNDNYPINFYTDGLQYMKLDSNGLLGLSDTWTGFNPRSVIHLHRSGNTSIFSQITNGNTGSATGTDGFRMGLNYDGFSSVAELRQFENSHMTFFTNNVLRMRIDSVGKVGINTTDNEAQLEIRASGPAVTGMGWNAAIKVANESAIIFDNDDPAATLGNRYYMLSGPTVIPRGDFMHSLFPDVDGNDTPQYVYRLYGQSRVGQPIQGVHRFLTTVLADERVGVNTLFPAERVEVVDGDTTQLRLTNTQAVAPANSRATDFQTTDAGDLFIFPHDSVTRPRSVGINRFTPISTLHVGGTAGTTGAITSDFLNHSSVATLPTLRPWLVYSDTNGTLQHLPASGMSTDVLHGDGSWGPGGAGTVTTGCGSTTLDFVPKFSGSTTTLCNSQIYDHATNGVGIGTTTLPSVAPLQRLTVNGNLNLSSESHALYLNNRRFLTSEGNSWGWSIYLGLDAGPAGSQTNTGYGNYCIGNAAGNGLSGIGGDNILIGASSGSHINGNGGLGNVCIGSGAGIDLQEVRLNTLVGTMAGSSIHYGIGNVALGGNALSNSNGYGDDNIIIGQNAQLDGASTIDSSIAIGVHSVVFSDRSVALGQMSRAQDVDVIVLGDPSARTLMGYTTAPTGGFVDSTARLYVNPMFNGSRAAFFNGSISTTHVRIHSDANLKTNIQPIQDASHIIDQLKPKTYLFDAAAHPGLNLPDGILQYGLLAQDVETILPNLVGTEYAPATLDTSGAVVKPEESFKALDYISLIPILIKGMQEQKARIDQLESEIQNCCGSTGARLANPAINVELSNSIILNQNDPNPFAEETKVTYNIPSSIVSAKIIFFDNSGRIIQTVIINERGAGQLNVFASDLTSGIYSYSLIADGKIVDTKKMVVAK